MRINKQCNASATAPPTLAAASSLSGTLPESHSEMSLGLAGSCFSICCMCRRTLFFVTILEA